LGEGPVADNGIDAQWQGDLSAEALTAGPFLSAGANVSQYKKREVTDQTRSRLVADMCADLRGAVVEVERRSGTRPAAYVLLYQYRSARWSAIYAGD